MSQLEVGIPTLDLHERLDARIREFFDGQIHSAAPYGPEYLRLWRSARATSEGGKRLRPAFVLTSFRTLGGRDDQAAVEVATAFELLHTAFLLHDDVIDGDLVRRGAPNLAAEFRASAATLGERASRAELWGQTAAILAGDLLIHFAQGMIARLRTDASTRVELLDLLDASIFVTAAGELADVALSMGIGDSGLPDVLAMTEHKTAAYSCEGPLVAGATLAGASARVKEVLGEYGRVLGVAFQLGDDLLGVFGAEELTGKSALNDLREGKETLLIAYARTTSAWPHFEGRFGQRSLDETEAARLRLLLDECGARSFVEGMIGDYAERAVELASDRCLPQPLQHRLSETARRCVGRLS
jgi:geranylgeranyl pyrophosphate synthase